MAMSKMYTLKINSQSCYKSLVKFTLVGHFRYRVNFEQSTKVCIQQHCASRVNKETRYQSAFIGRSHSQTWNNTKF